MRPSKRKRNRTTFISSLVCGLILLPIVFVINSMVKNTVPGLELLAALLYVLVGFLLLMGIIGTIVMSIKPFIECTEIGIDAHGKRYLVANNSDWYFNNLSSEKKQRIKDRIIELESWKEKKIHSFKTEIEKDRFIKKYNNNINHAFYCYIYRSGTRYTQSNYVKRPYIGKSEYWGQFYSINDIKKLI